MSSDDENDQYYIKATGERMTKEELNRSFLNMAINEKKNSMIDALRKLKAVVNKYRDDLSKFQFSDKSEYLLYIAIIQKVLLVVHLIQHFLHIILNII